MVIYKFRKIDKEIINRYKDVHKSNDTLDVNIKIKDKSQIVSNYSFDEIDKLNSELSEYISDKSKYALSTEKIKLNFYTNKSLNRNKLKETIQSHYANEYKDAKKKMRKNSIIGFTMLIYGIIVLTLIIILSIYIKDFNNISYVPTILEITSWVFIWESVDCLFLERPSLKEECRKIQKIYIADIRIINNKKKTAKS